MNYMKDIAKNFVAKKNIEQMRETRAERTTNANRSPRNTDNKNKTKRETKSMTPALRNNLRPQTAQPSTFGSPLKKVIDKEQKTAKEPQEMLTPKLQKNKDDKSSPVKKPKK